MAQKARSLKIQYTPAQYRFVQMTKYGWKRYGAEHVFCPRCAEQMQRKGSAAEAVVVNSIKACSKCRREPTW